MFGFDFIGTTIITMSIINYFVSWDLGIKKKNRITCTSLEFSIYSTAYALHLSIYSRYSQYNIWRIICLLYDVQYYIILLCYTQKIVYQTETTIIIIIKIVVVYSSIPSAQVRTKVFNFSTEPNAFYLYLYISTMRRAGRRLTAYKSISNIYYNNAIHDANNNNNNIFYTLQHCSSIISYIYIIIRTIWTYIIIYYVSLILYYYVNMILFSVSDYNLAEDQLMWHCIKIYVIIINSGWFTKNVHPPYDFILLKDVSHLFVQIRIFGIFK